MKVHHVAFFVINCTDHLLYYALSLRIWQLLLTIGVVTSIISRRNLEFEQCIHCQLAHVVLPMTGSNTKALVNGDPLYRTNCCSWCFLAQANEETFVLDTNIFAKKSEIFLCLRNKFCVRTYVAGVGTWTHLCQQQCFRHSVSSFATFLTQHDTHLNITTHTNLFLWFIIYMQI